MKKIAFVMNNMTSGGVQVSIINLLKKLSNFDLDISLFLTSVSGIYINDIPSNVKIVPIFNSDLIQNDNIIFYNSINKDDSLKLKVKKCFHKLLNKLDKQHINKYSLKKSIIYDENFDYVIDYLGYGSFCTYYSLFGIKGDIKITFIHDEKVEWINNLKSLYNMFDNIYCVSNSCKEILDNIFPAMKDKTAVCRNIIDKEKIYALSTEKCELNDECKCKLLTIGRFEYQKGYDLLLKVAEILKKENFDFIWYIIGNGSLYEKIENDINIKGLKNHVVLLGMQKNPYKYLKNIDIYVQTSRHEGYGIAIAEARSLNIPVISTNLKCVAEQINNEKNGFLVSFDEGEFAKCIKKVSSDKDLYNKIVSQLKKENIEEEIDIVRLLEI